ncbi:MAG: hypothetical protein LBE98_04415 [Puniceicoccales bacterium]|jgi:hypothetical protein|nr:hypothetical protein [Puniceicoccales bacterium]
MNTSCFIEKYRKTKNIIFFVVGLLIAFTRPSTMALPLFNTDGSLTEDSKYLCQALGIDDKVTNAQQFTEFFQTNFLGYTEEEFQKKCDSIFKLKENTSEELLEKLLKARELLDMGQIILPKKAKYDYVIILGARTREMIKRCKFIRNEMANIIGNNPDTKVFFIASQRPLDPKFESVMIKQLKDRNLPQTEKYAAQLILEQELGEYFFSCEFVGEKQEMEKQNIVGNLHLSPGAMVVVDGNPFIALQDNSLQNILGQRWFESGGTLETVGPADNFPYDEVNRIEDQKTKHALQRYVVWCYFCTIASCAVEEFRIIKVSKQLIEEKK